MTFRRLQRWLTYKWRNEDPGLVIAYRMTFQTMYGDRVLQHLIDNIYCTVCESSDPIALAAHNARRSVVHDILMNIDLAEHPNKYEVKVEQENANGVAA